MLAQYTQHGYTMHYNGQTAEHKSASGPDNMKCATRVVIAAARRQGWHVADLMIDCYCPRGAPRAAYRLH
jgi:hypothetical protein